MFSWTDYASTICRLAAPRELAGKPIYILDADAEKLPLPDDAAGFTSFHLADVLRDQLEASGRWLGGPGFATVISPTLQGHGESRAVLESRAIVCAVHELAHHCEHLAIDAAVVAAGIGSLADVVPSETYANYAAGSCGAPALEPWRGHGVPFVRSILHLVERLRLQGMNLIAEGRAAGAKYGLSPLAGYRKAIGHEPAECVGQSLVDVLRTPPPQAMVARFNADVARFKRKVAS